MQTYRYEVYTNNLELEIVVYKHDTIGFRLIYIYSLYSKAFNLISHSSFGGGVTLPNEATMLQNDVDAIKSDYSIIFDRLFNAS